MRTRFTAPPIAVAELELLRAAEAARAEQLQREGVIRELWREAGTSCAWGVWVADDRAELDRLVASLPCSPHMHIESWEITDHPNRLVPRSPGEDAR